MRIYEYVCIHMHLLRTKQKIAKIYQKKISLDVPFFKKKHGNKRLT
jgi:hypothetical protein